MKRILVNNEALFLGDTSKNRPGKAFRQRCRGLFHSPSRVLLRKPLPFPVLILPEGYHIFAVTFFTLSFAGRRHLTKYGWILTLMITTWVSSLEPCAQSPLFSFSLTSRENFNQHCYRTCGNSLLSCVVYFLSSVSLTTRSRSLGATGLETKGNSSPLMPLSRIISLV